MKKIVLFSSFLAFMCLAAVMLSSCSKEETTPEVVTTGRARFTTLRTVNTWVQCTVAVCPPMATTIATSASLCVQSLLSLSEASENY